MVPKDVVCCATATGWISEEFLPTCRKRLRAAHSFLAEELRKMDVPYLHRPVGFFIWADFSKVRQDPTRDHRSPESVSVFLSLS